MLKAYISHFVKEKKFININNNNFEEEEDVFQKFGKIFFNIPNVVFITLYICQISMINRKCFYNNPVNNVNIINTYTYLYISFSTKNVLNLVAP